MSSSSLRSGLLLLSFLGLFSSSCGDAPVVASAGSVAPSEPVAELAGELKIATSLAQPLSGGLAHNCAVLEGGAVKCWGVLALGVPGAHGPTPGTMGNNLPSVSLGAGRTAIAVAAGETHSCALLDDGSVKCWGSNFSGQLGLGDTVDRSSGDPSEMGDNLPPVQLGLGRSAKAIGAGFNFTCALLDTNQIKCWGSNGDGELGLGDANARGDAPGEMGDYLPTVDLGSGRSAQALSVGFEHACALLDNAQVKCWGNNFQGELGLGDQTSRGNAPEQMGDHLPQVDLGTSRSAVAISAGTEHTCALLNNSQMKCWGSNANGELGLGNTAPRGIAPNQMGDKLPQINVGQTVKAIAAGEDRTCAILNNNLVKCWGYNALGQLGLGDTNDRGDAPGEMANALPFVQLGTGRSVRAIMIAREAAGSGATCAALDDGSLKCWGANSNGELGLGTTGDPRGDSPSDMGDALPAVSLGSRSATTLFGAGHHVCVVTQQNELKCWGMGFYGQLGQGNQLQLGDAPGEMGSALPSVDLGTGRTVKALAVGELHNCALINPTNQLKCWGRNDSGQLGLGNTLNRGDAPGEMGNSLPVLNLGTGRTVKSVFANEWSSCAILDNDQLKCWGNNVSGQLGLGDTNNRGDAAGEMGNALPAIDLGTGHHATSVAMGSEHTCALLENGHVKCWGSSVFGQLGQGDTIMRGDQPGEMGDSLPEVNLGTGHTAKAIAAAWLHTCAILDDDHIKCWGGNGFGGLGYGNTQDIGDQPGEMGDALPEVELGTGRTVLAIAGGIYHFCALLDSHQVKCWGSNFSGELGLGDREYRGDEPGEMGDHLPIVALGAERSVIALAASEDGACVVFATHEMKCWGENGHGDLGQGDFNPRGTAPNQMDENLRVIDLGPGN